MMRIQKILFIFPLLIITGCQPAGKSKIDRNSLINRHNVILSVPDKLAPLSVGNGKFCYTADVTGMQTFTEYYREGIPLSTMSEWGWHSFPNTQGYKQSDTYVFVDTYGRNVPYPLEQGTPSGQFLRANPHQATLALAGLKFIKPDGQKTGLDEIRSIHQELNVWKGVLSSKFEFEGKPVEVLTICHPVSDLLSFKISSPLFSEGKLAVQLYFPYASGTFGKDPADFENANFHSSTILYDHGDKILFSHQIDEKLYFCKVETSSKAEVTDAGNHYYIITPEDSLQELTLSIDLSQYLTAIQSRQKYPPQETGLTFNSWYGKFHLEMHWWHSVHFALWNRLEYLENTLGWYDDIYNQAVSFTQEQGYKGVRWPKMVGPVGSDAPSGTGPLLIWQQPHTIYYAELIYRQKPTRETLEKYNKLIQETASFMADFAVWNEARKCYFLGPPLKSAREFGSLYNQNLNPTFELAYWTWGLKKANDWRARMGQKRIAEWDKIAENMACWPVDKGVYVEEEAELVPDGGHPCQLAAYGILPASSALDKELMRKTLNHVMDNWEWGSTWGWDYPMVAMTAARLNEPQIALDALLKEVQKNTYLPNGHNYQHEVLPIYLPGNGGLLTAVAMMCAGWDGSENKNAPGFPDDGSWVVNWEVLQPLF